MYSPIRSFTYARFTLFGWLPSGQRRLLPRGGHAPGASSPAARYVPSLEVLEGRTLPSVLTVLNNADSGPGSLRQAILTANADPSPDTITFADGLQGTITLTSGELLLSNSVTITGPGANVLAVSGNNASRVFDMTPGLNVTISGLTVTDGYALDQGGGILNQGSNLALSADVLSQNVASGSATPQGIGGGLQSVDGLLTITDCTITGNQALGGTSAVGEASGGGIEVDGGSAMISNSTFSDNSAVGETGVTDPSAGDAAGGAINTGAPMTLTGCTFSDNSAMGGNGGTGTYAGTTSGGAIDSVAALTITNSTFSDNSAVGGDGDTSTTTSGSGAYVGASTGGAICCGLGNGNVVNSGAALTITGSSFSDNSAVGGDGDIGTQAGSAYGGAISPLGPAFISDSTFDHNQALGGSDGNSGPGQQVDGVSLAQGGADIQFLRRRCHPDRHQQQLQPQPGHGRQ